MKIKKLIFGITSLLFLSCNLNDDYRVERKLKELELSRESDSLQKIMEAMEDSISVYAISNGDTIERKVPQKK